MKVIHAHSLVARPRYLRESNPRRERLMSSQQKWRDSADIGRETRAYAREGEISRRLIRRDGLKNLPRRFDEMSALQAENPVRERTRAE